MRSRSRPPVIAALDPSRPDSGAAALGLLLARATGARLILASAYPEHDEGMRTEALQRVEAARVLALQRAGGAIEVSSTVIADDGATAAAIHRLARLEDAALIVVGSSARGRFGRVLPGAVTDRLLHRAPCAVAVATAGFSAVALRLIGVAFLDRPDGWAALTYGSDLARAAGADVRVVTVREPMDWTFSGPLDPAQHAAAARARDEAAERTLRSGAAAVPRTRWSGGEVLTGRPHDALAAASEELDLLVCGARGYGPVRTLLLGSVSHALVREAACPVLVVPLAGREPLAVRADAGRASVA